MREDELCKICFTSDLGEEPCSQLSCGHIFHTNCLVNLLKSRWTTLKISFGFMKCPCCNQTIDFKGLSFAVANELGPLMALKIKVEKLAMQTAREQGVLNDERLTTPGDIYFEKPQEYANHRCSFFLCHKCESPYFGGLVDCEIENAQAANDSKPEDLICQDCLLKEVGAGKPVCDKHGKAQIDWKC